jgi:aspartyl-tRNA(Asn)/glutamyl-tRNA(Gln) amidotransferase subunit B
MSSRDTEVSVTPSRTADWLDGWELVVGLEVHVELTTRTKMWCGCPTVFGGEPNTGVCPVCSGQPGALPVPNRRAFEDAVLLGLALGGTIAARCRFHRKNYFYPDLAKNYQISQYDVPLVTDGRLEVEFEHDGALATEVVGIERLHMEEDTGKSLHLGATGRLHGADRSAIDYNRSGVPLLEIVSHPDIRDPETAQAYLRELQAIVRTLGVSDARMEEGSIRCDANVSVRRTGEPLGTRCEIKNLNSVRSLGRAIRYEALRQVEVLEDGGAIVMETRHWDEEAGVTRTLRRKETVTDYRYFPDPDLVEMTTTTAEVEAIRAALPELPAAARARLDAAGVPRAQAATILAGELLGLLDAAVDAGAAAPAAANWLAGEVTGHLSTSGTDAAALPLSGAHLAELVAMVEDGTLSSTMAKQVLAVLLVEGGTSSPREVAAARGLEQMSDDGELGRIIAEVVAANAEAVASVRDGNDKAIGALVGQVMRATGGKADPRRTNELLREAIASSG